MTDNYAKIVQSNLNQLYNYPPENLAKKLLAKQNGNSFIFDAFGEKCIIEPKGITFNGREHISILGILISLYALNACSDSSIILPLKSFREFPGSMPYRGAFTTHTELLLVPHVNKIRKKVKIITETLNGKDVITETRGDFSFIIYPLPKIALCYIFYEADDDFPASVTCLYSNNACLFLPVDGLADVGEYTSRKILKLME